MFTWIAIGVLIFLYVQRTARIESLEHRLKALEDQLDRQARLQAKAAASPAPTVPAAMPAQPAPPAMPTRAAHAEAAQPAATPPPVVPRQPQTAGRVVPLEFPFDAKPAAAQPTDAPTPWAQATDTLLGLVRKNPFASLGVLLMLVGVGFLFSLLAASNILPPAARVLLLAGAGVAVFAVGLRQEAARYGLALNLQGGAIALEFLCVLWSYHGYGLISPTTAFALMGGLSALSVGWATLKHRSLFVLIGLAGALGTPLFASTGQGDFANLALYGAWVSALGIASALRLGAPFLASAALAGLSLLLWAATGIPRGNAVVTEITLTGLALAYCGAALAWTRASQVLDAKARASVVALLVGAPLVMAGLLHAGADVDRRWCAALLGLAALADLVATARANASWRPALLAIGAALGLVAIGVGLDGPSRALALSGSALGLVLMARAQGQPWAGWAALVYWLFSVVVGMAQLQTNASLHAWPLGLSGAVALAAGYLLRRDGPLGAIYAFSAPLVLGLAVLHPREDDPMAIAAWGLAWAAVAVPASRAIGWAALRQSAGWLLLCGLPLFASALPVGWTNMDLALREGVLLAWLAGSSALVWRWRLEPNLLALLSLAPPAVATLELFHTLPQTGATRDTLLLAVLLLWSGWTLLVRLARFDANVLASGVIASFWLALHLLIAHPGLGTELAQWLALAALLLTLLRSDDEAIARWRPAGLGLAGAVLLGTALRAVGAANDLDLGVGELLLRRDMQPWVSVFWAAAGIALVAYASRTAQRRLWTIGSAVIAVLVAKMLLIDLATFSLGAKVAVFMCTGLGFLALGTFCPLPPQAQGKAKPLHAG